jgi:hypothetical protein
MTIVSHGFFADPELGAERRARAQAMKAGDLEAGKALRAELDAWQAAERARLNAT